MALHRNSTDLQNIDEEQNQRHKPELLSELGAEVLGELGVVLQAGQQEATALVQQNSLSWTQRGLLQVRQNQHHLLYLVTKEGQLQRQEDRSGQKFKYYRLLTK